VNGSLAQLKCFMKTCPKKFLSTRRILIFALACSAVSPIALAVVPPPDGAYPNFTTAEGQNALQSLTTGAGNTALGAYCLFSTTTASFNTAIGAGALDLNTGDSNTAVGVAALLLNTGTQNTAVGVDALFSNTSGGDNTAVGLNALLGNTTGNDNTATGAGALVNNTIGASNTADGFAALANNTTGTINTAIGDSALHFNSTGNNNTAVGVGALSNNSSGFSNIALGFNSGENVSTANHVIAIGAVGDDVNNSCFIGNIRSVTTAHNDAVPVLIDSNGQLGTASSSRRYKTDIEPIDKASESIFALNPVRFRYKVHKDSTPQFGLIAEQVAEINPDLVIYEPDGKPYTVRYDAVNAMLLNEFLKEHRNVEEQQVTITQLQSKALKHEANAANQQKQIEALAAGLQKVSAQLKVSEAGQQTVLNRQ